MFIRKVVTCLLGGVLVLWGTTAFAVQPLEITEAFSQTVPADDQVGADHNHLMVLGNNFMNGGVVELRLGGNDLVVVSQSDTEIVAELPLYIGAGSYQLVATTGGGTVREDVFDGVTIGAVGPPGADGTNGTDGVDGADGAAGAAGPAGADGTNGTDGVDGADGADGATGPAGADGTNGTDGVDGADGADGAEGPQGTQGPPGSADLEYRTSSSSYRMSRILVPNDEISAYCRDGNGCFVRLIQERYFSSGPNIVGMDLKIFWMGSGRTWKSVHGTIARFGRDGDEVSETVFSSSLCRFQDSDNTGSAAENYSDLVDTELGFELLAEMQSSTTRHTCYLVITD